MVFVTLLPMRYLFLIFLGFSLPACIVSAKKFKLVQEENIQLAKSQSECQTQINDLRDENYSNIDEINFLKEDNKRVKNQLDSLLTLYKKKDSDLQTAQKKLSGLEQSYKQLGQNASTESNNASQTKKQLDEARQRIDDLEDELLDKGDDLREIQTKLDELQEDYEILQEKYERLLRETKGN